MVAFWDMAVSPVRSAVAGRTSSASVLVVLLLRILGAKPFGRDSETVETPPSNTRVTAASKLTRRPPNPKLKPQS